MEILTIKKRTQELFSAAPFLQEISNQDEYESALALLDELIEDYEIYRPLIEMVSSAVSRWEDSSEEFRAFNERLDATDSCRAVLRVLMDQYRLTLSDFEKEIGKKSMMSQVMNGHRNLTVNHIGALSKRFGVSPEIFIH